MKRRPSLLTLIMRNHSDRKLRTFPMEAILMLMLAKDGTAKADVTEKKKKKEEGSDTIVRQPLFEETN